ncbi:MAG: uroporphyrinogen-III C-methyltransferase, partial [Pseudomonadota bacterium]|nr:uroporphyrinogen-III C-methyltransferase [Pseudomonadota bacterium]
DRLVDPAVLDLARRDARRVDVGKAAGRHAMPQAQINALLVREARQGRVVVRLKGGDPFVFGRGGEELEALAAARIVAEVVPGVTAASGCAAAALIPLTHREVASACVFVTGHARGDAPLSAEQWTALARLDASLAIYMGVGNLANIVRHLTVGGRAAGTPAAVVDRGTTPAQRVVTGTLETIVAEAETAGVCGPALVLVGEVVALRERFLFSGQAVSDLAV